MIYFLLICVHQKWINKHLKVLKGAVAEWSKALLKSEEKINKNKKILGSTPGPGTFKKFKA